MAREIIIDPVTRIEGHAKITIQLDDDGQVADARFHVTQFRGFERICQGRPVHELPSIMARICGICPVSHLIASAKACDQILATEPPPTGVDLRRIMNLAQVVQSHALSFFHLSSPDLLFGFDAEPGGRHLFGVLGANPQLPSQVVPRLLQAALPVHRVVKVDLFLPGCPPSADLIYLAVNELLEGRMPDTSRIARFGA